MCGIWGIIPRAAGGTNSADLPFMKQMMLDTIQRGEHSSGLFMTEFNDIFAMPTGVKVLGPASNIIYNKNLWGDITKFVGAKGGALIGHGRHATRGKITAKNAHPFQEEHITLVHNGTLYGQTLNTEVEVDSHALCIDIAKRGIVEALVDIDGAYALIAHDAKEGCLYIARNKDRPLCLYSTHDRHYIMSEAAYLAALVRRNNQFVENTTITQFKEHVIVKIDLNNPREIELLTDLGPIIEEKKAKKELERKAKWEASAPRGNSGHSRAPSTTVTHMDTKAGSAKSVVFEVIECQPSTGGNFRYNCLSQENDKVYFITDSEKPEYIGKAGRAKVHGLHAKDGQITYFVKHRSIDWIVFSDAELEEGEVASNNAIRFQLANKKIILASEWEKRIKNEGCDVCCKTFSYHGFADAVLADDDKFLCRSCAEQFHLAMTWPTQVNNTLQ